MTIGRHLLIDIWCTDKNKLTEIAGAKECLKKAALLAGATVINQTFHSFGLNFGFSGVIVLAESHVSIHTWPEKNYAAIDVFMCGDCDPNNTIPIIQEYFGQNSTYDLQIIKRGQDAIF